MEDFISWIFMNSQKKSFKKLFKNVIQPRKFMRLKVRLELTVHRKCGFKFMEIIILKINKIKYQIQKAN